MVRKPFSGWVLVVILTVTLASALCVLDAEADEWVRYVPSDDNVSFEYFALNGTSFISVSIYFGDSGYNVSGWGSQAVVGTDISVDADVWMWMGITFPLDMTLSHQYDLGQLLPGCYVFTFNVWTNPVKSTKFVIPIIVPDDYPSIQEAINAAWDGDTIFVRNGTHYENLIVNKTVSLIGENKNTTIIEGGNVWDVVYVVSSFVQIENFTIQNSQTSNQLGIRLSDDTSGNVVMDNVLRTSSVGIYLHDSSGNIVSNNDIGFSGSSGIELHWSSNNKIENNHVTNVSSIGIGVWGNPGQDNEVVGNKIMNCGTGLVVGNLATRDLIRDNLLMNCNKGIDIWSSNHNTFYHNSLVNNTLQIHTEYSPNNTWDNGYPSGGNYWSDYNGTDYDDDWIGDTPYIIDENNTDHYPLMSPWAPPDVEMENFETSKAIARQGSLVTLDIQYEYQGNTPEIITLDVYLNSSLLSSESLILPPGHHWYTTRIWNTTGFVKGNYTVTALLQPLQDELDTADNALAAYIFITIAGDLNGDKIVDIFDAVILANHFNLHPWQSLWDSNVDMNDDDVIDIFDAVILASHYGESWT